MGRNFAVRPSQLLKVDDEVAAFDFDLAATQRLLYYDSDRDKAMAEVMSAVVGIGATNSMFGATGGAADDGGGAPEEW